MKLRKVRALLDHKKFAEELKKLGKTQEEFAEDMDMCAYFQRLIGTYQYLWLIVLVKRLVCLLNICWLLWMINKNK